MVRNQTGVTVAKTERLRTWIVVVVLIAALLIAVVVWVFAQRIKKMERTIEPAGIKRTSNGETRARVMQSAGCRACMLAQIEGPKLGVSRDL